MPHVGDFGTFTTIPSHHAFREEICANLKGWEEPRMASPKKKTVGRLPMGLDVFSHTYILYIYMYIYIYMYAYIYNCILCVCVNLLFFPVHQWFYIARWDPDGVQEQFEEKVRLAPAAVCCCAHIDTRPRILDQYVTWRVYIYIYIYIYMCAY